MYSIWFSLVQRIINSTKGITEGNRERDGHFKAFLYNLTWVRETDRQIQIERLRLVYIGPVNCFTMAWANGPMYQELFFLADLCYRLIYCYRIPESSCADLYNFACYFTVIHILKIIITCSSTADFNLTAWWQSKSNKKCFRNIIYQRFILKMVTMGPADPS